MRNGGIEGRVAVVTGASRGIGAAIAQRLASAGATVVVAARSIAVSVDGTSGTADETVQLIRGFGGQATAIACDVEDAASRAALIRTVVERFGRIDILVNNAGRSVLQQVPEMDMATSRAQAEQYLFAPLDLALQAIPHMTAQGSGWIVNLGSSSAVPLELDPGALGDADYGLALYAALKSAVHQLTSGLSIALSGQNIGVGAVAPVKAIATPGIVAQGLVTPERSEMVERVEHIAEATLDLVSRDPAAMTGRIAFSYRYLDEIGRSTMSLDGRSVVQARG